MRGKTLILSLALAASAGAGCSDDNPQFEWDNPCAAAVDSGGAAVDNGGGSITCSCEGQAHDNSACDIPIPDAPPIIPPPGAPPSADPRLEPVVQSYQFAQNAAGKVEESLQKADLFVSDAPAVGTGLAAKSEDEKVPVIGKGEGMGKVKDGSGEGSGSESGLTSPTFGRLSNSGGGSGGGAPGLEDPKALAPEPEEHAKTDDPPADKDDSRFGSGGGSRGDREHAQGNAAMDPSQVKLYQGVGSQAQMGKDEHSKTDAQSGEDLGSLVPPMRGSDPDDYFSRIPSDKSLFEIVHDRYTSETKGWEEALP